MTVIDDDRKVARQLIYDAVLEIRFLASQANQDPESYPREETLERIRFLADLVHNLPFITDGPSKPAKVPRHEQPQRRRAQALEARPMTWAWLTAGPQGQDWITKHLDAAEVQWSAPPPLPTSRKGIPELTTRQRIGLLTGWPVRTPPGLKPLPHEARVLKALDTEAYLALCQEASHRKLGWGGYTPWLRAHVDPDATHYIVPDPAEYYWPDPPTRYWWQCSVILRMIDGELVSGGLAVMPQTFLALPSTVSRRRQRRLAFEARLLERDVGLWGKDHQCPQLCGWTPAKEE